jgi:hypothetical protein
MSKFLLNLLVQISKAYVNSKILFFILKGISFSFRPSWPNRPTGLLSLLTQPAFLPPPVPKQWMPKQSALRRPGFTPPWMHYPERHTASRTRFPSPSFNP